MNPGGGGRSSVAASTGVLIASRDVGDDDEAAAAAADGTHHHHRTCASSSCVSAPGQASGLIRASSPPRRYPCCAGPGLCSAFHYCPCRYRVFDSLWGRVDRRSSVALLPQSFQVSFHLLASRYLPLPHLPWHRSRCEGRQGGRRGCSINTTINNGRFRW